MYQLTKDPDLVVNLETGASIPRGHRWWDEYEQWLSAGNIPDSVPDTRYSDARETRNGLLRSCDWTQMADNSLTGAERTAWAAYRQLLRDVPQQAGFPDAIQWPDPPPLAPNDGDQTQQY